LRLDKSEPGTAARQLGSCSIHWIGHDPFYRCRWRAAPTRSEEGAEVGVRGGVGKILGTPPPADRTAVEKGASGEYLDFYLGGKGKK
jgi:hypothetical protein